MGLASMHPRLSVGRVVAFWRADLGSSISLALTAKQESGVRSSPDSPDVTVGKS